MKKPQLVDNWKTLWKSLVMWSAGVGLVLPEILQLITDQTQAMASLDADTKNWIRIVCLALVIVFRPIKQTSMTPPKE
jgi:hypothetical protein